LGGKTSTTSQDVTVPPQVLAAYQSVNAKADATAAQPFQTYGGQFVAPVNSTQQTGIAGTTAAANEAQPLYGAAAAGTAANAAPISSADINSYLSPYLGDVLGSTEALQNQSNQQQQAGQLGDAISSGAFGGDRTGIAAANLEEQQNLANSNVIAGIANQGYSTALGTAETEQQAGLAGSQQLANIGSDAQTSGLQGAAAEISAGTVEQQTQQAQDTAEYNQFLQQQSYPFQVDQFLANIAEGTGALSGSTTTTQQPGGFFSDRRLKRDIKKIGKTYDGQDVVTYKMGDDNRTRIGLIAQDVEKKHPEAVGVASGYKTVDYGKATRGAAARGHFAIGGLSVDRGALPGSMGAQAGLSGRSTPSGSIAAQADQGTPGAANEDFFYAGGVVPFRRRRDAGGGTPYGDDGLGGVLQAQQAMYAGMGGNRQQRQISEPTGTHQLAVASGSPAPPQSGNSQLNSAMGTVNNGYSLYKRFHTNTPSTTQPTDVAPANTVGADYTTVQPAGLQSSGATTYADPAATATAVPDAAAPAADAGSGVAAGAGDAAAGAAGDAAAGTAADAAGTAVAGVATDAAADAAVDAAAAAAAEYAAADVGAVALMAAKRGGKVRRRGYDLGGAPYTEPGEDSAGDLNIPDDGNSYKLQAAGPIQKVPTGMQTLMTMSNPDPSTQDNLIGSVFSNQATARGGVVGRRGYDDGGSPTDDGNLSEMTISADRDQPAYDTVAVPDQTVGVAQSAAPEPVAASGVAAGDAEGAPPAKGPSLWDKIKGSALAKPENLVPLLQGIAAMGTARTVHPGVALAAGLGAGAGSYVDTQEGLAQAQRIQAITRGQDIQNQITGMKASAAADYLGPGSGGSGVVPSQGMPAVQAPVVQAPAIKPTGAPSSTAIPTPNSSPPASPADTAANIDQVYRQKYFVQPGYTPDEQAQMQKALGASMVLGDAPVNKVKQAHDNRVQTAQASNQNAAQAEADGLYSQATDPNADYQTAQAAAVKYNAIHQWTGDSYNTVGGNKNNSRTGAPAIGTAAAQLTPEQLTAVMGQSVGLVNVPNSDGTETQMPAWQAHHAPNPETYAHQLTGFANSANPAPSGSAPTQGGTVTAPVSTGRAPAPVKVSRAAMPTAAAVPTSASPAQPTDQYLAKALADPSYRIPVTPTIQGKTQSPTDLANKNAIQAKARQLQDDADAATAAAATSLQYMNAAKAIMQSKGAPVTGLYGGAVAAASKAIGGIDSTNYQEAAKYLGNAAAQLAKGNFPNATQSEMGMQFNELSPNLKMNDATINDLLSTNIRGARYVIGTANRAKEYVDAGNNPLNFEKWNNNYYPRDKLVNATKTASGPGGRKLYLVNGQWSP